VRKREILVFGSSNWFISNQEVLEGIGRKGGRKRRKNQRKKITNQRERRNSSLKRENHPKQLSIFDPPPRHLPTLLEPS